MTTSEQFLNKPELEDGDLIFIWGRDADMLEYDGWRFIGIPGTRIGFSCYFVTGEEGPYYLQKLEGLVTKK